MKKTFIVAGGVIILALIISQASQSKLSESKPLFDYNFQKCSIGNDNEPSCGHEPQQQQPRLSAEKFLRKIKLKARIAYA
jgi:hypothetical protein